MAPQRRDPEGLTPSQVGTLTDILLSDLALAKVQRADSLVGLRRDEIEEVIKRTSTLVVSKDRKATLARWLDL